jgi:thiol-disulfide isomerase/thioredoxin
MKNQTKTILKLTFSVALTVMALFLPARMQFDSPSLQQKTSTPTAMFISAASYSEAPAFGFASDHHAEAPIQLIAVKMDAVWCGRCQVMNPKLDNVRPTFNSQPVLFVKFDMTDEFTTFQSGLLADRLNLTEFYDKHAGKTGYMVLVNPQTGLELATLTSNLSEQEITEAIANHLNRN